MLPRTLPALVLSALTASLLLTTSAAPAHASDVRFGLGPALRLGADGATMTGSMRLGIELEHNLFLVGQLESFLLERDWDGGASAAGWRVGLMYEAPLPLPLGLDGGVSLGQSLTPMTYAGTVDSVTTALAEVGLTAKLGPARLRLFANTPIWSADPGLMDRIHSSEFGLRLGVGL